MTRKPVDTATYMPDVEGPSPQRPGTIHVAGHLSAATTSTSGPSPIALVLRSSITKLGLTPISGLAAFVGAAVTIRAVGGDTYGAISVFTAFIIMLPFLDFGLGAAVIDAVSQHGVTPATVHLISIARRRLTMVCIVVLLLGVTLSVSRSWGVVLGSGAEAVGNTSLAGMLFVLCFVPSIPLSLGGRVLLAVGRQPTALACATLGSLVTVATIWGLSVAEAPSEFYVVAVPGGMSVGAGVAAIFAARVARPAASVDVDATISPGLRKVALPMFIVMVCLPLALHSDRVVLSHVSRPSALNEYTLMSQIYLPIYGIATAGFNTLWPSFNAQRSQGESLWPLWRISMLLAGGAAAAGGLIILTLGPPVARVISDGSIVLPWPLVIWTVALLAVQLAHYPSAMSLMDAAYLRLQAVLSVIVLLCNVPLSVVLAQRFGSSGPIAASVLVMMGIQAIPTFWVARVRIQRSAS